MRGALHVAVFTCALSGPLAWCAIANARPQGVALQTSFGAGIRWLPETPSLHLDEIETPLRTIRASDVATTGGLALAGAHVDLSLTLDDRLVFPLVGAGFYSAVGERAKIRTSVDGSIAELRPWTAMELELLIPGVGVRFKERRWMFAATLRPALVLLCMGLDVANGATSVDPSPAIAARASIALRADLEVCRRLDPASRACLFVAPSLYEYGVANGGTIGLRWEMGP